LTLPQISNEARRIELAKLTDAGMNILRELRNTGRVVHDEIALLEEVAKQFHAMVKRLGQTRDKAREDSIGLHSPKKIELWTIEITQSLNTCRSMIAVDNYESGYLKMGHFMNSYNRALKGAY